MTGQSSRMMRSRIAEPELFHRKRAGKILQLYGKPD
jgi:hypothetical protein